MTLKDPVQLLEVAPMESDNCLGFQHALMAMQPSARRQRPQKPAEPLHGACLLENLDRRHHRLEDDRQGGHTVSRQNSSRSPLILVYLVCFSIVIISSRIYFFSRKGQFYLFLFSINTTVDKDPRMACCSFIEEDHTLINSLIRHGGVRVSISKRLKEIRNNLNVIRCLKFLKFLSC